MINSRSIAIFFKGIAMGISDLIPGISGGTIALLLGIYEEFIKSLKSINYKTVTYLFSLKIKKLSDQINLKFLLPVFCGIIFAIFTFSNLITFLLNDHRILLFTFFFGLILFSSLRIIYSISIKNLYEFISIIFGIFIGYALSLISPFSNSSDFLSIYISGFIAVSAMLLPGISGSYILLILGKYELILESVNSLRLDILSIFILGAISGVILFSKLINWLLKKFFRTTILLLSGLMLGALNKVWPWQINGLNYTPDNYSAILNSNSLFFYSIIVLIITFILSFLIKPLDRK